MRLSDQNRTAILGVALCWHSYYLSSYMDCLVIRICRRFGCGTRFGSSLQVLRVLCYLAFQSSIKFGRVPPNPTPHPDAHAIRCHLEMSSVRADGRER